jgi:hypothetical protein
VWRYGSQSRCRTQASIATTHSARYTFQRFIQALMSLAGRPGDDRSSEYEPADAPYRGGCDGWVNSWCVTVQVEWCCDAERLFGGAGPAFVCRIDAT